MKIVLDNVSKIYKSGEVETVALTDVSLEINEGDFIVILGPSGSGKSTLLNVISGLDSPSSGSIKFNDNELTKLKDEELTLFRRKYLGFVFQQYNLLQNLTAIDNIRMGVDISENPLDVDEIIEKVGLKEHKDKYPYQMSGGEQQRVSVARSVVKNPKIMFCDEPTGSLDEQTAKKVLLVLEELNKTYNITMVVITHNPGIAGMADIVIKMNSGEIEEISRNKEKISAQEVHWG